MFWNRKEKKTIERTLMVEAVKKELESFRDEIEKEIYMQIEEVDPKAIARKWLDDIVYDELSFRDEYGRSARDAVIELAEGLYKEHESELLDRLVESLTRKQIG